jgi:phage terminase Nu1 subunit (DNA packaging protein)
MNDKVVATTSQLGEPLNIHQVAELLGLSPWTIRHSLIPKGLPVFRSGASGKLIFYREQVVRWVIQHQQKGGERY